MAPSDIVFNRPPAANSISTGEFFTGVQSLHVKTISSIHNESCNSSYSKYDLKSEKKFVEIPPSSEKRKESETSSVSDCNNRESKFIDELTTLMGPSTSKIPPPLTTCLVDSMVRSCSVGMFYPYLVYLNQYAHCKGQNKKKIQTLWCTLTIEQLCKLFSTVYFTISWLL